MYHSLQLQCFLHYCNTFRCIIVVDKSISLFQARMLCIHDYHTVKLIYITEIVYNNRTTYANRRKLMYRYISNRPSFSWDTFKNSQI